MLVTVQRRIGSTSCGMYADVRRLAATNATEMYFAAKAAIQHIFPPLHTELKDLQGPLPSGTRVVGRLTISGQSIIIPAVVFKGIETYYKAKGI